MPVKNELYVEKNYSTIIVILSVKKKDDDYRINWKFLNEQNPLNREWKVSEREFKREWRILSPVERVLYEI
jgi:hypothetical protein